MAIRVAINGFGRIGRNILRAIAESGRKDIEVVGINDLGPVETNAHLLRFDSVHGRFPGTVTVDGDSISLGANKIKVSAERDPSKLPWKALGVDVALECTGIFTSKDKASAHLTAGAKRVLVLGLLAQAFGALGYVFVRELAAFYAVAAIFGFIYAGTMPLYSVLIRENFPLRMMGTVIGGTAMAGSLGMATGPLAGGLIYDTFASYTWLYVGSWATGLGAFLIMMTFRPMASARPTAVPASA